MAAALTAVPFSGGPAAAADACTTPQLTDVMVSQGLPTYGKLARGKSTLVKLFLSTPACLPVGASVAVQGATLTANTISTPIQLSGPLPLPPLGSPATAPVASAASDVQFLVPGDYIKPATGPVTFSITVGYVVTTATTTLPRQEVTFATMPGASSPIGGDVAPAVLPAGVLVVPMGDAAKSADSQYPAAARSALQVGMTSLNRVLPVADSGGLVYNLSAGLLNLGAHTEPSPTGSVSKNYLSTGSFCGSGTQTPYIAAQLEAARVAWNSLSGNPKAQRVLGQVWQGISTGGTTTVNSACAEGFAQLPGTAAWGRTVGSSLEGTSVTGAIAAMEYMHTVGGIPDLDARNDGGHHSKNVTADATAPGRAYNIYSQSWLADNKTAMSYSPTAWNDRNTLYEKADWDWLQCSVLPAVPTNPVTGTPCTHSGELTYAGAAPAGSGSFVVTGSTDGTAAGTEAYSYTSSDTRIDPAGASPAYAVVQRSGNNTVVRSDALDVHFETDEHDGSTTVSGAGARGAFGAAVPADSRATAIEIWKGAPAAAGSTLLYSRARDNAPQFLSAQAQGQSISASVADERPADLRLDLFLSCPGGTSPLATGISPTNVGDKVAVFVQPYDTSLGCANGHLVYRVTDGFLATTQNDSGSTSSPVVGSAAIYSPTAGDAPTAYRVLNLTGSARDAVGATVSDLRWSLAGPSFPVQPATATGSSATLLPPAGGFRPGSYTLTLQAFSGSSVVATATRSFSVRADVDGDGIADSDELQSCYAANAVTDPANAVLDSDFDGIANIDDPAPCSSTSTTGGQFTPTSLYKSANGNNVKVQLVGAKVDLTRLHQSDIYLTQIAGYATATLTGSAISLPATSWTVVSPSEATVTFDRTALSSVLSQRPSLVGYIPFFVGTLDGRLHGADPAAPNVFP